MPVARRFFVSCLYGFVSKLIKQLLETIVLVNIDKDYYSLPGGLNKVIRLNKND
ncbi:hypothetical protein SAMN05444277_11188 [Parafilimonas terrae]|uniref:Uncharacterized protein n=1 Tax=Parafilimonas terrae TaxID=1465490 RepID=A0A1I5YBG4_9BACT|nr:hypothetical protein SAMN05444277_11188 [Parafilimonas terrae]